MAYTYKGPDKTNKPPAPPRGVKDDARDPKNFTNEACGTKPGRERHTYYRIPPCEPCKAAARAYQQQRRAAKQTKN